MPKVLREDQRVARTPHRCDLCGRTISKGEGHWAQTNIYDGRIYTFRTCEHCEAFISVCGVLDDIPWDEEGYGPDALECFDPGDRYALTYQQRWRRRWTRSDGTLYPIPVRRVEAA